MTPIKPRAPVRYVANPSGLWILIGLGTFRVTDPFSGDAGRTGVTLDGCDEDTELGGEPELGCCAVAGGKTGCGDAGRTGVTLDGCDEDTELGGEPELGCCAVAGGKTGCGDGCAKIAREIVTIISAVNKNGRTMVTFPEFVIAFRTLCVLPRQVKSFAQDPAVRKSRISIQKCGIENAGDFLCRNQVLSLKLFLPFGQQRKRSLPIGATDICIVIRPRGHEDSESAIISRHCLLQTCRPVRACP
jgi:hypothetical protein